MRQLTKYTGTVSDYYHIYNLFFLFVFYYRNQLDNSGHSKYRNQTVDQFMMDLLQYKTWWEIESDDGEKRSSIARLFLKKVKPTPSLR